MNMELLNHQVSMKHAYDCFGHSSEGCETGLGNMYQRDFCYKQWLELEMPLLRRLLQRHKSRGASRVLDFACGTGRILKLLEREFESPTGIDVSETTLGIAQRKCRKSVVINHDITDKPLDSEFDIVTAFWFFLEAKPQLRVDVLRAINSALSDDGVLIANIQRNTRRSSGLMNNFSQSDSSQSDTDNFEYPEFVALLEKNGFEPLEIHRYSFLPNVRWLSSRLLSSLVLPFERFCRLARVPEYLCQSFVVVARKKQLS